MEIVVLLLLLILGYVFGSWNERRHYRSIIAREAALMHLPAVSSRIAPARPAQQVLVCGSVAVSVDYFKRFLSGLHMFFGGGLTAYESLLDRARREAILRMKAEADKLGAELILNVKYETASISKGEGDSVGTVEVLAYGTALLPADASRRV
ncbi:heavy metal-binding domain-containing protein [Granulosicoccaceae sp. 1_MG-2023]|nr:heavy metal-binding domain-containing protein [Granulosicoccaceae sp. 1_MG-2023]